jgi:ABC-2 type transport system ATP-binding protein
MSALELSDVSKYYGERAALSHVSLSLPAGSALGLLGPNGAGKTTTLRLLLGFVDPDEGEVWLKGRDPYDARSRRGIGYLPERLALPPNTTVDAFLRLHGRLTGLTGGELEEEIESVSAMTGITDRRQDVMGGLSKGLAQRVGFAQAFLGSPSVLLLDEPTSGLDPIGMREARDWIGQARDRGASVLVSSHLLSEVERVCDTIAILNHGVVVAYGPIDEVVRPGEELEDAFIRLVDGSAETAIPRERTDAHRG